MRGVLCHALVYCIFLSELDVTFAQSVSGGNDTSTSAAMTANPLSRSLTVAEFNIMQETVVNVEFETREEYAGKLGITVEELNRRAEMFWKAATDFEFVRALNDELDSEDPDPFPYLLCRDLSNLVENVGTSGYRNKQVLNAAIAAASPPSPLSGSSDGIDFTLYSGEDMYCGLVRLAGSVAERIECPGCIVQPYFTFMKLMPNTVQLVLDLHAEYYNTTTPGKTGQENANGTKGIGPLNATDPIRFPSADFVFCPNVVDETTLAQYAAGNADAGNDLTAAMTAFLLSKSFDNFTSSSAISESHFWTSSASLDLRREIGATTEMADFWAEVLRLSVETDLCDDTFSNRLNWTGVFFPPFSAVHVDFVGTDAFEVDKYCVLAMIAGLSTLPEVCAVEVTPPKRVLNLNAQTLVESRTEEERPFYDVGLDGKGQIVAVSDTGIDVRNCYFWDSISIPPSAIQFNGHRKVVQYRPFADDTDMEYGHGTHVAGTIAGRRATNGRFESDGAADGIARGAKIAFADIGGPRGFLNPPPNNILLSTGRRDTLQAHIHSASWGAVGINHYNYQSQSFDSYMFQNEDLLINVAAGNDGQWNAHHTVSAPATAKNILSVGSSHSHDSGLFPGQLGPRFVSSFSSRGPTLDGRTKPDLVAPGETILSAGARPDQIGACDDKGIPPLGRGRGGLVWMAGTSMATPVTSGTAAIVRQYFEEGWYPGGAKGSGPQMMPSSALVKAVLMNGAQTDMLGVDNGLIRGVEPVKPYDVAQGFGRISLIDSLYIAGKSKVRAKVWDKEVIADGKIRTFVFVIDQSNECTSDDLSVTLVWTEEGSIMGCLRCVLNDLDLYVTKNDDSSTQQMYYPNGLKRRDNINNAERVVIGGVSNGESYTVHVEGFNLDGPLQKFSLVATGCFVADGAEIPETTPPVPIKPPTAPPSSAHTLAAPKSLFGCFAALFSLVALAGFGLN